MAFKLRSGNTTNFKNMGSSPAKQKYTITWSDEEAKKRHEEKIKKEEEKKKKKQEKVDAQIEGTYELTEEDIKKMKEDEAKNPKRPSPNKQLKTNYWYKVNGKKVTYDQYKTAWKEGVDERRPNLQTNDPDAFGIKAKHKADREKLRKPTVLTEQQTKNLKK